MTTLGLLSPTSEPTASAASGTYHDPSPRRPLTPVIFAGPGSSLYPLCDPYSSSSADSLPKALLPLANRPLISLPLQQLVSAGLKHALVLASANQHRAIETALKGVRLHRPQVSSTSGFKSHLTPAQSSSNIVVVDGLSPAVNPASSKVKAFESAAIFVELLPLGPYDGKLAANLDDTENENSHHAEFRTTARPGTAELLRWLTSIGKLESDPLVMPVDFFAPSVPLSSFLLSYYSACDPLPPTVTALLYERGAGESVGREREKEGPAHLLSAWGASEVHKGSTKKASKLPPSHTLLLLSEPPVASSSLDIRVSLLEEHPRARMSLSFLDSHIYILRKAQIVPLLNARKDFTSIRGHLVPFITKASWQSGLKEKAGWQLEDSIRDAEALITEASGTLAKTAAKYDDVGDLPLSAVNRGEILMTLAFKKSSLSSPPLDHDHNIRAIACVARLADQQHREVAAAKEAAVSSKQATQRARGDLALAVNDEEERFMARANTLPTYLECNQFLLRSLYTAEQTQRPLSFPLPVIATQPTQSASTARNDISASAQLSPDSLLSVDASIKIGDRSSIKRCILAPRVTIGRNVRLAGCILMDDAHVGDGVKLENCVLGPKSKVLDRVTLKDSDVGFGATVKRDGKGEKISKEEDESDEGSDDKVGASAQ